MTYQYIHDGTIQTGHWNGDPDDALKAAIHCLAAEYDSESEQFVYEDPSTGGTYAVDEHDLVVAGAAILAGIPFWDWYTVWCTRYGDPVDA